MPRVLHVNTEKGFRGGERQVLLLVRGLRDLGIKQAVFCHAEGELRTHLEREGFTVYTYTPGRFLGVRSPAPVRALRAAAAAFSASIVHAHTGNAHTMALAAVGGKIPLVVTRRVDFPIKANRWSRRKYTAPGQHFIAISEGIRAVLIEGGVPPERIDLVYSGVDPARVRGGDGTALRAEWLAGAEGPLIGFVGALVDHKAPWVLARAMARVARELPGARCVFVGEGELRPELERIAAEHPGLITLAGWREDIADVYAALDLFVMPSKLEGLCTALIDALAARVPAIASRTGGIPEVLGGGEAGVLVEMLDDEELSEATIELWRDPPRRAQLIEAGRARVESTFTAEAMVRGNASVYGRTKLVS